MEGALNILQLVITLHVDDNSIHDSLLCCDGISTSVTEIGARIWDADDYVAV